MDQVVVLVVQVFLNTTVIQGFHVLILIQADLLTVLGDLHLWDKLQENTGNQRKLY